MSFFRLNQAVSPPQVQLLSPTSGNYLITCYDLETTGLELNDEIIQIGASEGPNGSVFSQYIVPPRKTVHSRAANIIGLQVIITQGIRTLLDLRTNRRLDATDERNGLENFIQWLLNVKRSHDGIVLVSHGAIFLDIPLLIIALRKHGLLARFFQVVKGFCDTNGMFQDDRSITSRSLQNIYTAIVGPRAEDHRAHEDVVKGFCDTNGMFQDDRSITSRSLQNIYTAIMGPRAENHRAHEDVVKGFCDTNGMFQDDRSITSRSLQNIYTAIVGPRAEDHRAHEDACDLFTLLLRYFKVGSLSLNIERLAQYTFTTQCMEEYVNWLEMLEPRKETLQIIGNSWSIRSVMKKKVLVKNLLAAGYTYNSLYQEFKILGEQEFKRNLTSNINSMKTKYESYLTDTDRLSTVEIVSQVAAFFRRKS